ncbi:hypothetical protein PseudUWO311_14285 [Pseudanabaena sp. UWO311]|uniref:hypothetical protein n=1 Tax=Pseudanabaena sp. UWO311 TaxID=2487337 RepID=UPI00115C10B2|nr:hypothetical protein [Pseudanabaena sp. UWO311]TYQ25862.1 hypothetical protein PseudUWO311_14285 [Pseudanabaena sp. UWO311]
MKNKYAQDFPESFGESPSEDSVDSLVSFLRQNKPIAPPPDPNFEKQLFAEINKYPQRSPKSSNANLRRWLPWALLIPVVIATGITFNWVTNRSQYQMANISESEKAEIEQSLISSWNMTDDTTYQEVNTATNSTDNQLLRELEPLEYE